jgi:hypothetical protein
MPLRCTVFDGIGLNPLTRREGADGQRGIRSLHVVTADGYDEVEWILEDLLE